MKRIRRSTLIVGIIMLAISGCRNKAEAEVGVTERIVREQLVAGSPVAEEKETKRKESKEGQTARPTKPTKTETELEEASEEETKKMKDDLSSSKSKQIKEAKEKEVRGIQTEVPGREATQTKEPQTTVSSTGESNQVPPQISTPQPEVPQSVVASTERSSQSKTVTSQPEGKAEKPVHAHRIVTETKAPTCTEAGIMKTYCADCGEVQSVSAGAPATGHRLIESWFGEKPTCNMSGYLTVRCEICGYIESSGTVPALECVRDAGTVMCHGDCANKTVVRYKCVNCGSDMGSEEWYEPDIHDWAEREVEAWNEELQEIETVTITYCTRCGKHA